MILTCFYKFWTVLSLPDGALIQKEDDYTQLSKHFFFKIIELDFERFVQNCWRAAIKGDYTVGLYYYRTYTDLTEDKTNRGSVLLF